MNMFRKRPGTRLAISKYGRQKRGGKRYLEFVVGHARDRFARESGEVVEENIEAYNRIIRKRRVVTR